MSDTEITIPQDVMLDDSRPPQSFPRADLYAQIAAKRRKEMDIDEPAPADAALAAPVDEPIADPVDPALTAPPPETPESPVYLKDGRWVTRRKVNGTEEEVDFDRLLAHDQKLAAADQRLAEASRMRREAEEALARAQTLAQQQAAPTPDERKALVRKYHQALLEGDDDAADDLLLQINGTASPPVDLSRVEAVAERRVQQTLEERDRREAVARFKRDFPAVAADDHLWDLADRLTMDVMAEGTHTGLYEIMAEAGRRAISRVTQAAQHLGAKPAQTSSPTPMETRRAAKAAAGRPVAGISATAPAKPEPRPPTASERIAQMQAARRGAVS